KALPGSGDAAIVHFDGNTWSAATSGTKNDLHGVSGSSATKAWAVGDGGTILGWDGMTWSTDTSNTTKPLKSVWAKLAVDCWVVGTEPLVHGDGAKWTIVAAPDPSVDLLAVFGVASDD